jgi:hypothetical protein
MTCLVKEERVCVYVSEGEEMNECNVVVVVVVVVSLSFFLPFLFLLK